MNKQIALLIFACLNLSGYVSLQHAQKQAKLLRKGKRSSFDARAFKSLLAQVIQQQETIGYTGRYLLKLTPYPDTTFIIWGPLKGAFESLVRTLTFAHKEGIITYVNDMFCKISKYSREELIGQNHRMLKSGFHPDLFYNGMWSVITDGRVWKGNIKNRAKDGSHYWVKTVIVPFLGKDGKPEQYIAVRTDITNQKKIEEKLLIALKEIRVDKLKDEFAAMVSHELRTPLTPIMFHCEMLSEDGIIGKLNPEQLNSVKEIERNSMRLEKLISDLLDAQKLDMSKMIFNIDKFNLVEFFEKVKNDLFPLMREKEIEFVIKNSVTMDLESDEFRLRQITDNLIKNAVDFVPAENGRIEIGAKREDSKVLFYVRDNGIGISEEEKTALFQKFYQVDTSITRKHGGTGLGLAISKGLVKRLGGKIWCESNASGGVTFYFSIPIKQEEIKIKLHSEGKKS